jgi:hypothetical protein
MISALLLCAMLFQASPQTALKPLIDNDRVTVWEVTSPSVVQPADAVIVSLSGEAEFVAKGAKSKIAADRLIVIDLKDHPPDPIPNTTGYPLAFPRTGSKKLLENERVIVWDFSWTPGVATPMHFHDKDAVIVMLEDGDLQSTTADGHVDLYPYKPGTVRFGVRGRIHTETLIRGKQRAIVTELK